MHLETKEQTEISLEEAVQLGAADQQFFGHFFFPNVYRQPSPEFHNELVEGLDSNARYVAVMVFRDGAKTTLLRTYAARKISYAISRTILLVGKSEPAAMRSLRWIRRQVEHNSLWTQTFGLRKGSKWGDREIEIFHEIESIPITLIAIGITGSTRGINVDAYRPDLIIVDDISDEDNTKTLEAVEDIDSRLNGDLRNSLAPASEAPHAKMVYLQTPLVKNDSISRCEKDPLWLFLRFSVFDAMGKSRWETRYPTEELHREKASYIARGKLDLWMREKECKIADSALAAFPTQRLKFWDLLPDKELMTVALGIDPVPPPSDTEINKGLRGKNFEVIAAVGRYKGKYYLLDYVYNRGHSPDWTIAQFFWMLDQWEPMRVRVETIAYQRTLKWLLEQEMQRRRRWVQINPTPSEKTKKAYRIIDSIGGLVASGRLYVSPQHVEFVEQYEQFPNVEYDDVIDAVSMGLAELMMTPDAEGETLGASLAHERAEGIRAIEVQACP